MIIGGRDMTRYLESDILVWLSSININNSSIKKLSNYFSDLREILEIDPDRLYKISGIKPELI